MNINLKKQLRNEILKTRNLLSTDAIKQAEEQILSNLSKLSQFNAAKEIFCYFSFRSEVPTGSIISDCLSKCKNVYIPVTVNETKEMIISKYDFDTVLAPSSFGVPEPTSSSIRIGDRSLLDAAIMPGAVFDHSGYRIGYGAGYYDKFFALTPKNIYKIALAYSFQVIDEVPRDDHDVPVDCIVTEKEIIMCKNII